MLNNQDLWYFKQRSKDITKKILVFLDRLCAIRQWQSIFNNIRGNNNVSILAHILFLKLAQSNVLMYFTIICRESWLRIVISKDLFVIFMHQQITILLILMSNINVMLFKFSFIFNTNTYRSIFKDYFIQESLHES